MRKILATAAVAGIMTFGFAAAPAQASTTTQHSASSISTCNALRVVAQNFRDVEVASAGSRRDGLLNKNDLAATASDPETGSLLRDSVLRLARVFYQVDAAANGSRRDGLIRLADLRTVIAEAC